MLNIKPRSTRTKEYEASLRSTSTENYEHMAKVNYNLFSADVIRITPTWSMIKIVTNLLYISLTGNHRESIAIISLVKMSPPPQAQTK